MNNVTIMNSRSALRKELRSRRQSISDAQQAFNAKQLCYVLSKHPKVIKSQHIAIYLAHDSEPNLEPFIQWCFGQNKQLYLPIIHPFSAGHLLFLQYQQNTPMVANRYDILEPKLDVTKVLPFAMLDTLLVPLVGFDHFGNRLGMGGGFFDRTLQHRNDNIAQDDSQPFPIGIAHDCQLVTEIPIQQWDIPLPEIITPSQGFTWPDN
jgi:5-formyltetrahydrofolate cyclo-ligase